jgi:hypothetical protein
MGTEEPPGWAGRSPQARSPNVLGPALQALALLLEDFAVGFKGAGDGGFGVAFGLFLQAVGRRGLGRGGLNGGAATEKFFARFLIQGVALVGDGGEKQVFLALEGFDGEFLQEQPAGLAFEGFDGGNAGGVAGEIKNDRSNGRGALPAVFEDVLAQRMQEAVKELAGNIRLGLGNKMVVTPPPTPQSGNPLEIGVEGSFVPEHKKATNMVSLPLRFFGAIWSRF